MPMELQAKILQTVETHTVRRLEVHGISAKYRIIAASSAHHPLVKSGVSEVTHHRLDVLR